jgi:hypothetical protein
MSVRIGEVNPRVIPDAISDGKIAADAIVLASRAGVEVYAEPKLTLDPIPARNYAALLVRAADEVERMRAKPSPEAP